MNNVLNSIKPDFPICSIICVTINLFSVHFRSLQHCSRRITQRKMYYNILFVFTLIWTLYYFLLYFFLRKKYNAEWISRIVAITHALAIARSVEYTALFETWPFDTMGFLNTNNQNITLCLTAGYFLFEIGWCLYMRTEGPLMLIHHTISITAMVMSLFTQRSASEVLLTTWGSELTNPFLQIRWFLREVKSYDTVFGYVNDWLFFVFFFVVRVVVGTCVAYHLYYATETALFMKFCGFSFYILSLVWMLKIFMFAQKRLFGGVRSRRKVE